MDFKNLLVKGLQLVHELSAKPQSGAEKLATLKSLCADILETVDDVVVFLPGGLGGIAKFVVDNPISDDLQRRYLAEPLAEMIYQIYKALWNAGGLESVNAALATMGGEPVAAA
jgi:hypothetical protein